MNKRVVITGLGVVSSLGIGSRDFWDGLLQGRSGISPITAFDTSDHFTHNGGEAKCFDPAAFIPADRLLWLNRATQMAYAAAVLAVRDAGLAKEQISGGRTGVAHGTTLGAAQAIEGVDDRLIRKEAVPAELFLQMPPHSAPAFIAGAFGCRGPLFMVSTACAAGNYAIGHASDLIRLGRADVMIAGAADGISRIEFTGFNQFSAVAPDRCRPFDRDRKGMIPAEGAGILILEALDHALARNATIYAEIGGYGLSCDGHHMTNASVAGITECMRNALRAADMAPDDVDYISAHGTGTAANDRAECAALTEVFGPRSRTVPVSSIKSMLGHAMGAASALEAIACALVIRDGILPPTINFETPDPDCDVDCVPNVARRHHVRVALNNSYAFGGNNASVVIKKFT
jgi:3-oxoacyl-[acyl-carrier-protein] synthase II